MSNRLYILMQERNSTKIILVKEVEDLYELGHRVWFYGGQKGLKVPESVMKQCHGIEELHTEEYSRDLIDIDSEMYRKCVEGTDEDYEYEQLIEQRDLIVEEILKSAVNIAQYYNLDIPKWLKEYLVK